MRRCRQNPSHAFGGRKIFEAVLEESSAHALSQPLICRWFNLHYIQKVIATGQRLIIFGRVKRKGLRLVVDHPECEVIEDDEEILIHFRRITPIYPATEGLSQRVLRGLIFRLLEQVDVASTDLPLPDSLGNGDDEDALRKIHFPESDEQLREVRARLVLGEFFRMQMQIAAARVENSARAGCRHQTRGLLAGKFIAALPFDLTRAQQRVLNEIQHDLHLASPMNRLLQGDVGSGKTVVAIAAILVAVESGSQAALMAPTQIMRSCAIGSIHSGSGSRCAPERARKTTRRCRYLRCARIQIRVAHASRVLVTASRRHGLFLKMPKLSERTTRREDYRTLKSRGPFMQLQSAQGSADACHRKLARLCSMRCVIFTTSATKCSQRASCRTTCISSFNRGQKRMTIRET